MLAQPCDTLLVQTRGMAEQSPPTRKLIERAESLADQMGHPFVGSEHLLLAIVDSDDTVAAHRVLRESGALPT
jgi:ATP-dependent Clp protease ATP-binding subunit ClpA